MMAGAGPWLVAVLLCWLTAVLAADASSESEGLIGEREASDGVRCYCNSAECVGTSYMCRAPPDGGCFSELSPQARRHDGRYGCLHHLADTAEEAMRRCQNAPPREGAAAAGAGAAVAAGRRHTLLLCCFQDLCNHEDSPLARRRLNLTEVSAAEGSRTPGYGSGEVWFKAATIAVPVCGAVILFLLVCVAVRLLRADAQDLKLRAPYLSHSGAAAGAPEVKKALGEGAGAGEASAPLLVAPGGCIVRVQRAELAVQLYPDCHIQR